MTDYQSYLKIGKPEHDNVMGLFRDRYEIIHSRYSFLQDMNAQGEATLPYIYGIYNLTV